MSFAGLRVLSLESRRAKEMEAMILRFGGHAIVAPSVQEHPLEDHTEALRFVDRLEAVGAGLEEAFLTLTQRKEASIHE